MADDRQWNDEYWPFVAQLLFKKKEGVKPVFCRDAVDIAMELHVHPKVINHRMRELQEHDTPSLEKMYDSYKNNPSRLKRMVKKLRDMNGFGNAAAFYEGVEVKETFEVMFRPIQGAEDLTPVMLVLILDLYFRLTPITMAEDTPEVKLLAKQMGVDTSRVVEVLEVFQTCDPYLKRDNVILSPLYMSCQEIWRKYANIDTLELVWIADEFKAYFE